MRLARSFELPSELQDVHRRGVIRAWLTIAYLVSAIVLLYFVKGNSQALKTAWLDDMLALVPPIVFLVSSAFRNRDPDERHPYGYHRAPSLAFLVAAVTLLGMGAYLALEAALKLVKMEHPSIGTISIFGTVVWLGYAAIAVMVYKIVVGSIAGHSLKAPARATHNKVLFTSATMVRADWMTAAAAGVGIALVGLGWWWADATAALLISLSIIKDGLHNVRMALGDLMDRQPETVDGQPDDVTERIEHELQRSPLVFDAAVRLRENGQVFFGEAFIVPAGRTPTTEEIVELCRRAEAVDWRIHELVVAPVLRAREHGDRQQEGAAGSQDGESGTA